MVVPSLYRQGAAVIARRTDGQYLLVRKPRTHHAWQFPQGGVEAGESFAQAALREFHEELGTDKIKLSGAERGIFRYDFPPGVQLAYAKGQYCGQEIHFFCAEFLGTDADINLQVEELADYRWVTPAELPALIEDPNYLQTVQQIISND